MNNTNYNMQNNLTDDLNIMDNPNTFNANTMDNANAAITSNVDNALTTGNTNATDNTFLNTSFLDNLSMMEDPFNSELFFTPNPEPSVNPPPQCPTPPFDYSGLHGLPIGGWGGGLTTNEDIKEILMNISSRLENLESAGARDQDLLRQIGFNVDMALPKLLSMTETLVTSVEDLRKSLKVFMRGLLNHLYSWHIEGDIEMGPDA